MINVMIIDDNEALRLGLRVSIEEESDMRVVGECSVHFAKLSGGTIGMWTMLSSSLSSCVSFGRRMTHRSGSDLCSTEKMRSCGH